MALTWNHTVRYEHVLKSGDKGTEEKPKSQAKSSEHQHFSECES